VAIRTSATPTEAVLEVDPSPVGDEPEGLRQLLGLAGATPVGPLESTLDIPPAMIVALAQRT